MLNRVILIGRLGADPELRYTPNGQAVCSFRIAVNRMKTKAQREQNMPPTTDWIPIVVWGQPAVNCSQYLSKGKLAAVDGRIQTRTWDDPQSGQKRFSFDVIADSVQFLSPRNEGPVGGGFANPGGGFANPGGGFGPQGGGFGGGPAGPGDGNFGGGFGAPQGGGFGGGGGPAPGPQGGGGGGFGGPQGGSSLGSEISFPDDDDDLPF